MSGYPEGVERDSISLRSPDFRRRLGYYLVGLAIGLLILGSVTSARKQAAALRERELQERTQTAPGATTPSPAPETGR